MQVRIETLNEKKLVGKSERMSIVANKTSDLWRSFMSERKAIQNTVGSDLYSMQVYDSLSYFEKFNPNAEFTKFAAIEVKNFNIIPNGFKKITINSGLYAVFLHKGPASEFPKTMQYIFGEWLPDSNYELEARPHFEKLGDRYKNNAPDSEEEVWIPIRIKT